MTFAAKWSKRLSAFQGSERQGISGVAGRVLADRRGVRRVTERLGCAYRSAATAAAHLSTLRTTCRQRHLRKFKMASDRTNAATGAPQTPRLSIAG